MLTAKAQKRRKSLEKELPTDFFRVAVGKIP